MGSIVLSASGVITGMVLFGNFSVEGVPVAIQWAVRITGLIAALGAMRFLYIHASTTVAD